MLEVPNNKPPKQGFAFFGQARGQITCEVDFDMLDEIKDDSSPE